jgi:RNA polymerase sigma factor (sigma-70 family)
LDRSDAILVRETLGGSTSAFDELMFRYQRLVFKIAYSFGGSRENALDIMQTAFLKSWDKLHIFRAESSFKTWILRIAYNEGINWSQFSSNRIQPQVYVLDWRPSLEFQGKIDAMRIANHIFKQRILKQPSGLQSCQGRPCHNSAARIEDSYFLNFK